MAWLAIQSAPRNGQAVLLAIPPTDSQTDWYLDVGVYQGDESGRHSWYDISRIEPIQGVPTHWQALPSPPVMFSGQSLARKA